MRGLRQHESLYLLSLVILFWAVFDGITTYVTPLVLTEAGISKTIMGLIISSSSVFGAVFDFLMCKLFKNSHYRRVFLVMFAFSFFYLLALATAKTPWLFLLAMVLWGVYYDLKNFGSFDFVARFVRSAEHSSGFGVLSVFQASGYLLAPLLAGVIPFITAGVFLLIAFLILLFLFKREKVYIQEPMTVQYRYRGFLSEINLWRRLDRVLLPVLIMVMTLNIIDAFFWTIGPLLTGGSLFLTAYQLPALLVGWFVGSVTAKFGKKNTAFVSLLAGSLVLGLLGYLDKPVLIITAVFFSSLLMSLSWPALKAAFADYLKEAGKYEKEIESLEDLYTNLGFVVGPALAGFLADQLGNAKAFSVLGLFGVVTAVYLMKITPKKIVVSI